MMEYQLQITLKKIEILNSDIKGTKVIATVTQGETTKRLANPRFIRNKLGSFYLERLTLITNEITEFNRHVVLQIWSIKSSQQQQQIGRVQIDIASLVKQAERTSTKADSCRCQLPNIILEFDTLVTIKKNQQSYMDSGSIDSFSLEQQLTRENNVNKFTSSLSEIKDERIARQLNALEKTLYRDSPLLGTNYSKSRQIRSNATPEKMDNQSQDQQYDDRLQKSEKNKVTRRQSIRGNGSRMNIFISKRKSKNNADSSPQKESIQSKSSGVVAQMFRKNNMEQAEQTLLDISSLIKGEVVEQKDNYINTPEKQSISLPILRKQTIATMPDKHNKVKLVTHCLINSDTSQRKMQNTSIDCQESSQTIQDLSKIPLSSSEFVKLNQHSTELKIPPLKLYILPLPNPENNPLDSVKKVHSVVEKQHFGRIQHTWEETTTLNNPRSWRKNLPNIMVPQYDQFAMRAPSLHKQVDSSLIHDISLPMIKSVSMTIVEPPSKFGELKLRPRRSSFRNSIKSNDADRSAIKKQMRVRYTPDVAIHQIDDKLNRLQVQFSKRDVKLNILYALVALSIGFLLGGL